MILMVLLLKIKQTVMVRLNFKCDKKTLRISIIIESDTCRLILNEFAD